MHITISTWHDQEWAFACIADNAGFIFGQFLGGSFLAKASIYKWHLTKKYQLFWKYSSWLEDSVHSHKPPHTSCWWHAVPIHACILIHVSPGLSHTDFSSSLLCFPLHASFRASSVPIFPIFSQSSYISLYSLQMPYNPYNSIIFKI